jgi:hypothetical protein
MYPTTFFKDYEISWQEPPATSAGYDMTISSNDADRQTRLEQHVGQRGALAFRAQGPIANAMKDARTRVNAILGETDTDE